MSLVGKRPAIALSAFADVDLAAAQLLAQQLGYPLLPPDTDPLTTNACDVLLVVANGTLALQQVRAVAPAGAGRRLRNGRSPRPGAITVDFGSAAMRHRRRGGQNELLGKAVGVSGRRQPAVLDATAGLGRDSFVLADMGCEVALCEREPVIAALLEWGLRAGLASADPWLQATLQRMRLWSGDARELAADSLATAEVVYLDPMFPSRDKNAAVKKEMALFQLLLDSERAAADADALLHWALQQDVARVVVKRPSRAPCLAGVEPSHQLNGKSVRFDVYVQRALALS